MQRSEFGSQIPQSRSFRNHNSLSQCFVCHQTSSHMHRLLHTAFYSIPSAFNYRLSSQPLACIRAGLLSILFSATSQGLDQSLTHSRYRENIYWRNEWILQSTLWFNMHHISNHTGKKNCQSHRPSAKPPLAWELLGMRRGSEYSIKFIKMEVYHISLLSALNKFWTESEIYYLQYCFYEKNNKVLNNWL